MSRHFTQIAIIGGGICGLWLLNILRKAGFETWLFEKETLGGRQTLASQGMIHGGLKYTLGGSVTPFSEAMANMPHIWRSCLRGQGPIDLMGLHILSNDYFLFSDGGLSSKLTAFFASKSLSGRISALNKSQYPEIFRHQLFTGSLYQLQDLVLDTPSLLQRLVSGNENFIFQGSPEVRVKEGHVVGLMVHGQHEVVAQKYIFAAGAGNQALLAETNLAHIKMQLRPLQQVMLKGDLPMIFAHAVNLKSFNKPGVTFTTHQMNDGKTVWYLGGNLAEIGAGKPAGVLIDSARADLNELLPWINLDHCDWATLNIDRAEPATQTRTRPDAAFVESKDNCIVCWPTKLTLAPMLGDLVLKKLSELEPDPGTGGPALPLPPAPLAKTPWEMAFAR